MVQHEASRGGFALALLSAATFGTSGTFATALIDAGWSPGAAVTVRISIAALLLAVPAAFALRGRWGVLRGSLSMVVLYGLIAVAGCQVCYFTAVQHLSVGVALLLEYMGIVLVVGWWWLRGGRRPRRLTVAGSGAAVLGLVLILDLVGGSTLDLVGVLWGLGAAVGLATFFILSARSDSELHPLVMASGGMTVGAIALIILGGVGGLPIRANLNDVELAGHRVSVLVPLLGLSVVAAVVAYVAGIAAARNLGSTLASFIGLTEVLFAVLFAWLFLGQLPTVVQLIGGALIVAGVTLVRIDELPPAGATDPVVMKSAD